MIEVSSLRKRFGKVEAVRDVSFSAPDGAITGLLGANGAGKSTTIRMIAGLMRQDHGTVRIDGDDPQCGRRGRLGALLDHAGLYPRLTARENLVYFGKLHGLSSRGARKRADQLLSTLSLESEANRRVGGFSLGQRAKVALGRALMDSPRNLLLDEPTNGLDVPTIRSLRVLWRKLRDEGRCIVFSSHVLDEVEQICDRVVILANGSVAGSGLPEELRRRMNADSLETVFVQLTERSSAVL